MFLPLFFDKFWPTPQQAHGFVFVVLHIYDFWMGCIQLFPCSTFLLFFQWCHCSVLYILASASQRVSWSRSFVMAGSAGSNIVSYFFIFIMGFYHCNAVFPTYIPSLVLSCRRQCRRSCSKHLGFPRFGFTHFRMSFFIFGMRHSCAYHWPGVGWKFAVSIINGLAIFFNAQVYQF